VTDQKPTWVRGLETLRLRHRRSPEAVLRTFTDNTNLSRIDFRKYQAVVTTGIGSSAAHARYLAWVLRTYAAMPCWDVPTGAFIVPSGDEAKDQALVVFSQGLSPNARIPLEAASRFGCTVLVTAAGTERGERAAALKASADAGVLVIPLPVDPEYEVLLRIIGPLAGYAVALRMVSQCTEIRWNESSVAAAMSAASDRAEARVAASDPAVFRDPITFVTAGGYGCLTSNLCAKVTEGMFLQPPVAVDALELAHGYLQEAAGKPRTFIALTRNSQRESNLFSHVRASLEPQHRWLEFEAKLPDPLQIFEHESAMNAFVLAAIAARQLDQREWPGKGRDQSLYNIASAESIATPPIASASPSPQVPRRLADLTWTEVEGLIRNGARTAVIPLGATEQHGPHLPLRIDSIIADALAERFCRRVPGSIQAPAIEIGCSSEHSDFPGTLSIAKATLGAVLEDVVSSLVRHGFTHLVVFSAHGGNDAALAELKPRLKKSAPPARITVVHGIDAIGKIWCDASAREGIPREISGAHAGEFETSIIAALRPDLIRWSHLNRGLVKLPGDPQTLFYPSLRKHAANGVVGDPRAAAAERAERYLSAWVEFLIAAYEETERAAAGR
jgi:creatinine amidohydrolase